MGGRGSSFLNFNGAFNINVEDTFDKDTETKNQTNIVKKLKTRGVKVMTSSDIIPNEILTPNLKALDKVVSKFRNISDFIQVENLHVRTEKFSNPRVKACFRCKINEFERPQIIFNKSIQKNTRKDIEQTAKENIKVGYWSKSDDSQLVNKVMLHEIGHFVQRVLTEQISIKRNETELRNSNPRAYDKKIAEEMHQKILKINKNKYNDNSTHISKYGESDRFEFFAETFAELMTTNNPSNLAKSLDDYLKGEK